MSRKGELGVPSHPKVAASIGSLFSYGMCRCWGKCICVSLYMWVSIYICVWMWFSLWGGQVDLGWVHMAVYNLQTLGAYPVLLQSSTLPSNPKEQEDEQVTHT